MANKHLPAPTGADPFNEAQLAPLLDELATATSIDQSELRDMVAAVGRNESYAEFLGADPGVLASIENAAVTFYNAQRYQDAENVFLLLSFLTQHKSSSARRGLAACKQMTLAYNEAIAHYVGALELDPQDLISAVHLAECLLLTDLDAAAFSLLEGILADAEQLGQSKEAHIKRARALLSTREGAAVASGPPGLATAPAGPAGNKQKFTAKPAANATALPPPATPLGPLAQGSAHRPASAQAKGSASGGQQASPGLSQPSASTPLASRDPLPGPSPEAEDEANEVPYVSSFFGPYTPEFDHGLPPAPQSSDPEVRAFLAEPGVREQVAELQEQYRSGAITLRDIADFDQEQIDAGYAVCYKLLERRLYAQCLEQCGWMLHIDSHDARFYQLAGLAAYGLGLYCYAEYLFATDCIWRTGGPDPATLIYQAECLLQQEEYKKGLALAERGVELAQRLRNYGDIVQRGKLLLAHFGPLKEQAAADIPAAYRSSDFTAR